MERNLYNMFSLTLLNALDSGVPEKTQQEAMSIIRREMKKEGTCFALSVLILPDSGKHTWENCAKLISELSDEELEPWLIKIAPWFAYNMMGSYILFERIHKLPKQVLFDYIRKIKKVYDDTGNTAYLEALEGIADAYPPPGGHNLDELTFLNEFKYVE